jgi:hypothetical protein
MTRWDIKANYIGKGDWTRVWDAEAQAPYVISASQKGIIVYDDPESIKIKVDWAKDLGMGGFMWWESSDDPAFELHDTAVRNWGGNCVNPTVAQAPAMAEQDGSSGHTPLPKSSASPVVGGTVGALGLVALVAAAVYKSRASPAQSYTATDRSPELVDASETRDSSLIANEGNGASSL